MKKFNKVRWGELSKEEQKSHYWVAIPHDPDTILDGLDYEVVYVYFDGKWSVVRMGQTKKEPLANFRFLYMLDMPDIRGSASEWFNGVVCRLTK